MLSRPSVWIVRVLWGGWLGLSLWFLYKIKDGLINDPSSVFVAICFALGFIGIILIFHLGIVRMRIPEAYPSRFFYIEQSPTTLSVGQSFLLVHISIIFICLLGLSFLLDPALIANSRRAGKVMLSGLLSIPIILITFMAILRDWPCWSTFSVDEEGIKIQSASGGYQLIRYEDIDGISVSKWQKFQNRSITVHGKVHRRTRSLLGFGRFKEREDPASHIKIARVMHPRFSNEEVLERILCHCDDWVDINYQRFF